MTRTIERLRRFAPLVGIVLLALLLRHLDFREAWRATQAIPITATLLACGAYTLNATLKALRWHRMLRHQHVAILPRASFAAFMTGAFYGMLTIGRIGELLRSEVLTEHGQSKTQALANAIADRIIDAVFLLVVAAGSSIAMLPNAWSGYALLSALLLGLCALLWARRESTDSSARHLSPASIAMTGGSLMRRALHSVRRFGAALLRVLFGPGIVETLLWTVASWSAYFWAIRALALGLGIDAPMLAVVRAIALGTASAALPISFQGLGAREAMLTAALVPYGVSTTQALTLSLLSLVLFYVVLLPLGAVGIVARQLQRTEASRAGTS